VQPVIHGIDWEVEGTGFSDRHQHGMDGSDRGGKPCIVQTGASLRAVERELCVRVCVCVCVCVGMEERMSANPRIVFGGSHPERY
jgi:hypothetical protein